MLLHRHMLHASCLFGMCLLPPRMFPGSIPEKFLDTVHSLSPSGMVLPTRLHLLLQLRLLSLCLIQSDVRFVRVSKQLLYVGYSLPQG
jgi:hypothetical protein